MEGLYELTNALSNGAIPDPLRSPIPQDWWFATQPKTAIAIILVTGKATSYGLQIWPIHSQGSSEQKPMKNLGEKGAWAYPGTAQFF